MQLKSALWQRLFASILFGLIGFFGLAAMMKAFFPQRISVFADHGETPQFLFWSGLAIVLFSFFCWRQVEKYHVHADEEGITQRTGFRTTSVRWQEVAQYRLERVQNSGGKIEPVLYDSAGKVLFRPATPLLKGTDRMDKERKQFWKFVENQISDKQPNA